MTKKKFVFSLVVILLIFLTYLFYINFLKPKLEFTIIGSEITNIKVGDSFIDEGATASLGSKDLTDYIKVDLSKINTTQIGEFEVKYTLEYKNYHEEIIRYVRVNDDVAPKLTLIGDNPYIIDIDEVEDNYVYEDAGASATDNLDEKINDKIQIIENVNPHRIGAYTVDIYVADESGNTDHVTRNVYVVKDKTNINYKSLLKDNEITYMAYTDNGFYVKGYAKNDKFNYKIALCQNTKCKEYKLTSTGGYNFEGNIDITKLKNGTYTLKLDDKNALTYLEDSFRPWRGRIQDKMLTFNYNNKHEISVTIEGFAYEYDIVIDPGHGGDDIGAYNDVTNEKKLNLLQSEYEKERYEEHGLNVLLLREDDSYGIVMGDSNDKDITRKGIAVGYYSSVAKVSYSNHHNSNEVTSLSGWEIIAPAQASTKELKLINTIAGSWQKTYRISEDHIRYYARNFVEGEMFDKSNRQMYYFNDYYAVIRIPYDCFNTNHFIFEGSYLSNDEDFAYYYTDNNWQNFSEQKIKAVVEYLGKEYIAP